MMPNNKYQEEARKTLGLIDQLDRVEGNPYLYTRLQARMQREDKRLRIRWAIQLAVLLLLVAGNIYAVSLKMQETQTTDPLETLADEYGLEQEEWVINDLNDE
jgi:hypothetical protein